jgi:hypothetical protein
MFTFEIPKPKYTMNRINVANFASALILLLIPLSGCIKSEDFDFSKMEDIEWNPNLAVPLVSSNLTIMDIIKQTGDSSNFVVDNNNFVTLVYKDRLFSVRPMESFAIPQQSFVLSHTFTTLEANTLQSSPISISFQQDITLTPADTIRIDSLTYTLGSMNISVSAPFTNSGSFTFSMADAKKGGTSLQGGINPIASGTSVVDLSGYTFNLTKVSGKPSTIRLNATLALNSDQNIHAGDNISFSFVQSSGNVKVASGYFGRFYLFSGTQKEYINLFNNAFSTGEFDLVNPYFNFTFTNSLGLPIRLGIGELKGTSSSSGQSLDLAGNSGIPNPIAITSPAYNDINQNMVTTLRVDNTATGGAISTFINLLKPGTIEYMFNAMTNPNGAVSENFLRDSSRFNIDVEFGLPLYGKVANFAVQDTFDFTVDNIDQVQQLLIRSDIINEFPMDAKMQIFFTDDSYHVLDSLVTDNTVIVQAGDVNLTTGAVTKATEKISTFNYDKARINKIVGAEKILVKAVMNTSNSTSQNVKIYSNYRLQVKLAVQAQLNVKP